MKFKDVIDVPFAHKFMELNDYDVNLYNMKIYKICDEVIAGPEYIDDCVDGYEERKKYLAPYDELVPYNWFREVYLLKYRLRINK